MIHKNECTLLCSVFMFDYKHTRHIYKQMEQEYELVHDRNIGFCQIVFKYSQRYIFSPFFIQHYICVCSYSHLSLHAHIYVNKTSQRNNNPTWSNGQDSWLSPSRPGFNSRRGNEIPFYMKNICFVITHFLCIILSVIYSCNIHISWIITYIYIYICLFAPRNCMKQI